MVHAYQIKGLDCESCEADVKAALQQQDGITGVEVSKAESKLTINMKKHIPVKDLQKAIGPEFKLIPIEQHEHFVSHTVHTSHFNWKDITIWKKTAIITLNCLLGCSIGDFGMVIFLQHFYPATTMMTQMVLATIAGLFTSVAMESILLYYREKMDWGRAFKMAVSMSFLSIIAMEIAMNTTDFMITGGKMALTDPGYWLAFIPAALAGFLLPLPYNYFQLKKYNKTHH